MIVPDLARQIGGAEQGALERLIERLSSKRRRHLIRQHYYDGIQEFKDLGIALPPVIQALDPVLGWPAKGVDSLARRIKMEDFVLPGADIRDFGIDVISQDNRLDVESPQTHISSLIHATSFIATSLGDVEAGEPEVLIETFSAMEATGLWRQRTRDLGAALLVMEEDDFQPTRFYLMFPHRIHAIWRDGNRWNVRTIPNYLGRVPVEPLVYRPRLGRPFGSSRITRAAMSHTDSALRTIARAEVGAEFFSAPQRYLLGADETQFVGPNGERKTTWDLLVGRMLAIGADEETGETPEVGQFPQVSMQPHNDQMRLWAQLTAAEFGMPISDLGIVQDNPASAEAIYAAKESLVLEAEAACDTFTPAWVRSIQNGIMMRDNLTRLPEELRGLSVRWRDPSTPSRQAAVDATLKLTQGENPILPADSDVALEMAGLSDTQIERVRADRRRATGRATVAALAALESAQNRPRAGTEPEVTGGA